MWPFKRKITCWRCAGTGRWKQLFYDFHSGYYEEPIEIECPSCHGTGLAKWFLRGTQK